MAGIYDIGGERLVNVGEPTNPDHAATKRYVDENGGIATVPIAVPTESVIDSTTYDDPTGAERKIVVLVVADDETIAQSVALPGDDFPRTCMLGDITDGWFFGDGTFNPYDDGPYLTLSAKSLTMHGGTPGGFITVGLAPGSNRLFGEAVVPALLLGSSNSVRLNSGVGDPNGAVGGEQGDAYFRRDGGDGTWIYRCTVAGSPSTATWVGKL